MYNNLKEKKMRKHFKQSFFKSKHFRRRLFMMDFIELWFMTWQSFEMEIAEIDATCYVRELDFHSRHIHKLRFKTSSSKNSKTVLKHNENFSITFSTLLLWRLMSHWRNEFFTSLMQYLRHKFMLGAFSPTLYSL